MLRAQHGACLFDVVVEPMVAEARRTDIPPREIIGRLAGPVNEDEQ